MSSFHCQPLGRPGHQRGAAIVEFALVAAVFFMLLLGIFEFGRLMFTWNTAVQATRHGARLAVVCNMNAPSITSQVRAMLPPQVQAADISVSYSPSGCTTDTCQAATVAITSNASNAIQYFIPYWDGFSNLFDSTAWKLNIPPFSTTLIRESLQNDITGSDANPDCTA